MKNEKICVISLKELFSDTKFDTLPIPDPEGPSLKS